MVTEHITNDPDNQADISRSFDDLDTRLKEIGAHPTNITCGGAMVDRANGMCSSFSYMHPMTLTEVAQEPTMRDLWREESSRRLEKDMIAARKWKRRALWWRLFKRHHGIALHVLRTGKYEPKALLLITHDTVFMARFQESIRWLIS